MGFLLLLFPIGLLLFIFWLYGAFTSFKEGDIIWVPSEIEEWENPGGKTIYKIVKVGNSKYRMQYLFCEYSNLVGKLTDRDKTTVHFIYRKYTGKLP